MRNDFNWDGLVEDLGPRLYRYFCVRFSPEHADDLTQETLMRLVRKVTTGGFDSSKGSLAMFGFGIARFVALEAFGADRHESIEPFEGHLRADYDLEQDLISKDRIRLLRDKVCYLSVAEQEVLSLLVDQELKLAEIADIVRMPEGTVKSHISRAKTKLAEMIRKDEVNER